jgi:hypothetical protein
MRFKAASSVLPGAEPPVGVVAEKSWLQPAEEVVLVQVFSRLARELIRGAGEVPLLGKDAPGALPVVMLTKFATVATALPSPWALVEAAPTLPPALRNEARPVTVATVVTSLMTNCEDSTIPLHGPMAVANAIAVLLAAPPIPPPRMTI